MAALVRDGREVVMVSSGAIAEGMKRLGWRARPHEIHELQAAAAVGQMGLAQIYETKLRENGMGTAQVLLTHADLADRERYLNARSTLLTLLRLGVVPVINENDTVVNDEIKFGDNDTLGALVANLVEADALVILTDQKGLYTADPRKDPAARFVHEAARRRPRARSMAGGAGSSHRARRHDHQDPGGQARGRLGRVARSSPGAASPTCCCASRAARRSAPCWSRRPPKHQARKRWMADHLQLRGAVDGGCRRGSQGARRGQEPAADRHDGVEGEFSRGDVIAMRDAAGAESARGLANYSSAEARLHHAASPQPRSSGCWATSASRR